MATEFQTPPMIVPKLMEIRQSTKPDARTMTTMGTAIPVMLSQTTLLNSVTMMGMVAVIIHQELTLMNSRTMLHSALMEMEMVMETISVEITLTTSLQILHSGMIPMATDTATTLLGPILITVRWSMVTQHSLV